MSSSTAAPGRGHDERLAARIAEGDRDALSELYDAHAAAMLGVALRILKSREDAEDLVHDVFVEAWQKAGDYDAGRGTLRRWLLVRVRSRAIDRVRVLAAARRHGLVDAPEVEAPVAAPAEAAWDAWDRERARAALDALPAEQRKLIELGYFEGLTCWEMAGRCEIPIGTVKSRLAAAMGKLRRLLVPSGAPP